MKRQMKSKLLVLTTLLLTLFLSLGFARTARAEIILNVVDFGANGNDDSADATAFEDALFAAATAERTEDNEMVVVQVPAGTYFIDSPLHIYSNTTLSLAEGAVLNGAFLEGNMIEGSHLDENGRYCPKNENCSHGGHSQIQNVVIDGGTLDRDPSGIFTEGNNSAVFIEHGSNITLSNTTVMHSTNHLVNLSGCENVTVSNTNFLDNLVYTGHSPNFWRNSADGDPTRFLGIEAIHLDYTNADGGEIYPLDDTPVSNATISGCHFENVFAGIGTHHILANEGELGRARNFTVSDCSFENFAIDGGIALSVYSMDDFTAINNTATNIGRFAVLADARNTTLQGNVISDTYDTCVRVDSSSTATLVDNEITRPGQHGLYIKGASSVSVTGGKIVELPQGKPEAQGAYAFSVDGSELSVSNVTISGGFGGLGADHGANIPEFSGNTITGTEGSSIQVNDASTVNLSGNTISPTGSKANGMTITNGSTVHSEGNTITVSSTENHGIYALGSALTAQGDTIVKGSYGVLIKSCSMPVSLSGLTIKEAIKYGVSVEEASSNVSVSGCKIKNSTMHGISIASSSKATVVNNEINNASKVSILVNGAANGCAITDNTIIGSGENALQIRDTKGVTVKGNSIQKSGGCGIYLFDGASAVIDSNMFAGNAKPDIRIDKAVPTANGAVDVRGNTLDKYIITDSPNVKYDLVSNKTTTVSELENKQYTGKAVTQKVTVKIPGVTLKEGTDYKLEYKNNVNAGTASVIITGQGNYSGKITKTFTINALGDISKASITGISDKTYNTKSQEQNPEVKVGNTTLKSGTDYKLSYKNNTNVGEATLTINGTGGYVGSVTKTFKINTASIDKATVSNIADQKHDGEKKTPKPNITFNGTTLKLDRDYTLAYKNNVKVGTATITISGKGNFKGTTTKTFKIVPPTTLVSSIKVTGPNKVTSLTLNPGQSSTLTATVSPSNASNKAVTWTSSNAGVVAVDAKGKVTAKKAGSATITATAKDGSKKSGTFKITVRTPSISYRTHVQMVGWQNYVEDGEMSGTSGKAYRLEGINIKLANVSGGIEYRTHVQNIGWQDWKKNGAMSGTSGRALRLEGIRIRLTGEIAKYYDVYYRVHCQNIGWMGWAKNGQDAGSAGYAYRLEGIQIVLVPKGEKAPAATYKNIKANTNEAFREK